MIEGIVARAWADHGGALSAPPMSPWLHAVLWGVAALAVGVAIVVIINVVIRRRSTLGLVLILVVGVPVPVGAHAALVKSTPARGATVVQPPQRVELIFSERLEPAYSTVAVLDGTGQQVDLRDAGLSPADSRRLSVSLPPLPAGAYTVRFRVLSVDGHVVESDFPFTVGARGAAR